MIDRQSFEHRNGVSGREDGAQEKSYHRQCSHGLGAIFEEQTHSVAQSLVGPMDNNG